VSQLARLDFEERNGVVIARIGGELDLSNVHDVGDALAAAMHTDTTGLVLEMSELDHLDSAGIRLLYDLRARLATTRQSLVAVVPPDAPVREVLDLAAVPATVPVYDALESAVAAAGSTG
jgi:anti-anti-sigma factor